MSQHKYLLIKTFKNNKIFCLSSVCLTVAMTSEKQAECHGSLEDDTESHRPSFRLTSRTHGCSGSRAPSLSIDSGTFSVEPCQVLESSEGNFQSSPILLLYYSVSTVNILYIIDVLFYVFTLI